MEDPWAAGPSWSTPAKTHHPPIDIDDSHRGITPPPTDDADPWAATPHAPSEPQLEIEKEKSSSPVKQDVHVEGEAGDAWGGDHAETGAGWGEANQQIDIPLKPPDPSSSPPPAPQEASKEHNSNAWVLNSPKTMSVEIEEQDHASPPAITQSPTVPPPAELELDPSIPTRVSFQLSSDRHQVDEDDPEAAFAAALPRRPSPPLSLSVPDPSSPSMRSPTAFSDGDFGGFTTHLHGNDPWGGGGSGHASLSGHRDTADDEEGWGSGSQFIGSPVPDLGDHHGDDVAQAEEGGWGGVRGHSRHVSEQAGTSTQNEEWERAQRMMRLKADLAPDEKIQKLKEEWRQVATAVIGSNELKQVSDEANEKLEREVSAVQDETGDILRGLATIPSDINTYPPVLSSLTTYERYTYALSRPNPAPSTSSLTIPLGTRSRRVDVLSSSSSSSSPWLARSRLGEPEVSLNDTPADTGAATPDDGKGGRWSFWGKKSTPKPLVTSGGSILEVKSPPPEGSSASARASNSGEIRRSSTHTPPISNQGSRPSTPSASSFPNLVQPQPQSLQTSASTMPSSVSMESVGHSAPSGSVGTQTPQGPSAVSRFFGRLSRKHSSAPSTDMDPKDLELTTDDFSFLQEVPSLTEAKVDPGVGDLLSLEPGRTEEIASLESMLSARPTQMPRNLAAPPSAPVSRVPSAGSSTGAGMRVGSGKFVAKMKAPQATDMDLLGGLDFDDDNNSTTQNKSASSQSQSHAHGGGTQIRPSLSMWDNFMSGSSTQSPVVPAGPNPSNAPPSGSNALISSIMQSNKSNSSPTKPPLRLEPPATTTTTTTTTTLNDAFDDFDFATPQKATTTSTSFDDFGDFSDFDVPSIGPSTSKSATDSTSTSTTFPPTQPQPHGRNPNLVLNLAGPSSNTTPTHSRGPSVDHSSTMNLLSGASALKGRRWPAPPSPAAPNLDPPPKPSTSSNTSGFPFLSPPPPPPSRPTSGLSRVHGNLLDDGDDFSNGPSTPPPGAGPGPGPSPVRTARRSTLSPPPPGRQSTLTPPPLGRQGSLTPPAPSLKPGASPPAPALKPKPTLSSGQNLTAQDLSFFDSL